jgi:hypothetical protein
MNAGLQVFVDLTLHQNLGNPTALTQPLDLYAGFGRSVNVVIKRALQQLGDLQWEPSIDLNPTNEIHPFVFYRRMDRQQ